MQFKHSNRAVSASFDDPNLVSSAGLIPMTALAVKRASVLWLMSG